LANNVIQYKDSEGNLITTTSSATRAALERQLEDAKSERNRLGLRIESLADSVTKLDIETLNLQSNNEVAGEIGTLKYLAEITGQPMSKIINWFALMIVFVFDPLAVTLVIAFNTAMKIDKDEKEKEYKIYGDSKPLEPELSNVMDEMLVDKIGNEPTKERFETTEKEVWDRVGELKKKGKLADDTDVDYDDNEPTALANSQYRLGELTEEDVKIFEEAIENPPQPNDELKRAAARYKELMNDSSPTESKDEIDIDDKKKVQTPYKVKSVQTPWGERYID
jgi:hypothetical protein